jgi:hypothetical protein
MLKLMFMKRFLFLVVFAVVFAQNSQAQDVIPAMLISAGGTINDEGRHIAYDIDGNIYVCGDFGGTATFGTTTLTSAGNNDIFLAKYNSNGDLQWAKRAGGTGSDRAYGITVSATEVYISGDFEGTANFNTPSATGSNELTSAGNRDIYLAKYISNGDFQWAKRAGGTSDDIVYGVAVSGTEVYIAGYFNGTANFNTPSATGSNQITSIGGTDIFLAKFNSSGDFQWAKRAGGTSNDIAYGIAVSATDVYISGSFSGTANFNTPSATGSNEITSAGNWDIYLAKYNSSGTFQWARRAGGEYWDLASGIAVSGTDVYITGYFSGTANFNTPSATGSNKINSDGDYDIFLAKFNSSGDFQWAKRAGGSFYDEAYGVAVNGTEVYITGYFQSTVNFNTPTATGSNELTSSGSWDIFLAKYNSSGDFQWAKRAGDTGTDRANGVAVNGTDVFITGYFEGTANFNTPSATGNNEIVSSGSGDIFLTKYIQPNVYGYVYNDINENCVQDSEPGLNKRKATINPGSIVVETSNTGVWYLDSLPVGSYTITYDTTGKWQPTCDVTQSFTVTDPNALTQAPNFGLVSTEPCSEPTVSINMPFMRPGFSGQKVYVKACNEYIATGALIDGYVDVALDELITVNSASMSYTALGDNTFRFDVGTLNPGQCVSFDMSTTVSASAVLGQTLCMEALLYPSRELCVRYSSNTNTTRLYPLHPTLG